MFCVLGAWQIFTISILVCSSKQFYIADRFTLFYDEKTEAQNGEITCLRLFSQKEKQLEFHLGLADSNTPQPMECFPPYCTASARQRRVGGLS